MPHIAYTFLITVFPFDGFIISSFVLLGAIIALFVAMRRNLKKK